jgi:hypothetical protein
MSRLQSRVTADISEGSRPATSSVQNSKHLFSKDCSYFEKQLKTSLSVNSSCANVPHEDITEIRAGVGRKESFLYTSLPCQSRTAGMADRPGCVVNKTQ